MEDVTTAVVDAPLMNPATDMPAMVNASVVATMMVNVLSLGFAAQNDREGCGKGDDGNDSRCD
tara:strand:- start:82137 stop:82325 length:189 start_codon:yes stop_codon:yes gene_type:complete